jgi:four helix bundle protein
MSVFKDYKELDVWKKTRILVSFIYKLTQQFPKEEIYGLTSQMRRSAISGSSNTAEGIGRLTLGETIHFLGMARGSLFELETQTILSFDLGYINESELNEALTLIEECKKLNNGFTAYKKKMK